MRSLPAALLVGFSVLTLSGSAMAAPSFSLVWSATTGSGTVGSNVIAALPGDTLTLDVLIQGIDDGIYHVEFDLLGTGVTALSGQTCPAGSSSGSSLNFTDGTCFSTDLETISELVAGVTVSGSDILDYDAGSISRITGVEPAPLFVGRGVFQVLGTGQIELANGLIVTDSNYEIDLWIPPPTATIVPEPATLGLLALGLATLAAGRRR